MKKALLKAKGLLTPFILFMLLVPGFANAQGELQLSGQNYTEGEGIVATIPYGTETTLQLTLTNVGDAAVTWDDVLSGSYGRGPGFTFEKANFANWVSPSNQDRIDDFVWLARKDNQSLFNAKSESGSSAGSPNGTFWAIGSYSSNMEFGTFNEAHGNNPGTLVGQVVTMSTFETEKIYEFEFSSWSGGGTGGGFAYERFEMIRYITDRNLISGGNPINAAEQAVLGITFNTNGLVAGQTYTTEWTITGDPAGNISVPVTITVGEAPIISVTGNTIEASLSTEDEALTKELVIENTGGSALFWGFDEGSFSPALESIVGEPSAFNGEIAPGESQTVLVDLFAGEVGPGMYSGSVNLLSNDPANPIIPVTFSIEVTGVPYLFIESPEPWTGYVGSSSSGTFTFYNEGTSDVVVSAITSDNALFVPAATALTINPGQEKTAKVIFTPTVEGVFSATISVTSNAEGADQPETFLVEAEAVLPPVVNVTPLEISETLAAGTSTTAEVTVSNTGSGVMSWELAVDAGFEQSVTFTKPGNVDESLPEYQDIIYPDVAITRGSSGTLYNHADSGPSTTLWSDGPTTGGIESDNYAESLNAFYDGNMSSLPGKTVSLYLLNYDQYFDITFLSWANGGGSGEGGGGGFSYIRTGFSNWISPDQEVSGEVTTLPGESTTFNLTIDGTSLVEGSYQGFVDVRSNDPLAPSETITVNLAVTGSPDISTTSNEIFGAEAVVGSSENFTIEVANSGTGTLTVSDVTTDNGVISVSETSFTVAPMSVYELEATFEPLATDLYQVNLSVSSNDAGNSPFNIQVAAQGLAAPSVSVTPETLSATLAAGDTETQSFLIGNAGPGTLAYNIAGVYFEKESYADWTLAENQDRLSDNVWITRADNKGLFNAALESEYVDAGPTGPSPIGTLWKPGPTQGAGLEGPPILFEIEGANSTTSTPSSLLENYRNWAGVFYDCGPPCYVESVVSMYVEEQDKFYDVELLSWSEGNGNGVGSGGGFSYVRRAAIPWLGLSTYEGEVEAGGSSLIEVTFDASQMSAGSYQFAYDIETNDPANPVKTITFDLTVTGEPELFSESGGIEFDDTYVGGSSTASIDLFNDGGAPLVVSDVAFDDAAFSVSETAFTIPSGARRQLEVTFAPTAAELFTGTATVTSNDPAGDFTFGLVGNGEDPISISTDVSDIAVELISGGLTTKSFVVSNNSDFSGDWFVEAITIPGADPVVFSKSSFADWTLPENQDRISENVWITRANNRGLFNIAQESEFELVGPQGWGPGSWGASPAGTLWANGPTGSTSPSGEGGPGEITIEGGSQGPLENYVPWAFAVFGPGDIVGNVYSMYDEGAETFYDIEFTSWTSGEDGGGGGFSYVRTQPVPWITNLSSDGGTLAPAPDGVEEVFFDVDAEDLSAGTYEGSIKISNGVTTADVNVTLTVLGVPEIAVDTESLAFGSVFVGDDKSLALQVSNTGTASLDISGVDFTGAAFSIAGESAGTITPGETIAVEVVFAPANPTAYSETLTINSNDGDQPALVIALSGTGEEAPVATVSKTTFSQSLLFGNSTSESITITNDGGSDLSWSIGAGETVEFEKAPFADWPLAVNQDRISENVWITRGDQQGIFNAAVEQGYNGPCRDCPPAFFFDEASPVGTLWAAGPTGNTVPPETGEGPGPIEILFTTEGVEEETSMPDLSNYTDWFTAVGGTPPSAVGEVFSLYVEEQNKFYDILWSYWSVGEGNGGGEFGYTRTPFFDAGEAFAFSATEGVIAPGESQTITVFYNPGGTFDGYQMLEAQLSSNDPNGPVALTFELNVNGLITENPIADQVIGEGFGTETVDLSAVFLDAQDDPLNYAISSSEGSVATATEASGILSITEVGNGTATISITATDGKGSEATDSFEFTVDPAPVNGTALIDQTYEFGFSSATIDLFDAFADNGTLTYSAISSATGVVTVDVVDATLTVTEVGVGSATVTISATDDLGGTATDEFSVTVNPEPLGLLDGNTLAIYPNPVRDVITIGKSEVIAIQVFDLKGARVLNEQVTGGQVNLSVLESGVYSVKLLDRGANVVSSGLLIKE